MNAGWTTTDTDDNARAARKGEKFGGGKVDDRAIVITGDNAEVVVEGTADQLVDWTRTLYLRALRDAGRGNEADLLAQLNQRTYEPEPADRYAATEYVVDLYGASIGARPTGDGLRIDINLDDVLIEHTPVNVTVDNYDAGDFREDDNVADGMVDMDAVVSELRRFRVHASVEQSGGGTATIYAGTPVHDPVEMFDRYPVQAGPGHFEGPGWTKGRAWAEEFSLGLADEGETESHYPPEGATPADIARMILHVLAGRPPVVDGAVPALPDDELAALMAPANGPVIEEKPSND